MLPTLATPATKQFLTWLASRYPSKFAAVNKLVVAKTATSNMLAPKPKGMTGMGGFLDDLTSAINTVTSTVSTVSTDKALIDYNLQRAKQGLAPVNALPSTPVSTAPTGLSSMLSSPIVLIGGVILIGGLAWLLFGGKKKGKA